MEVAEIHLRAALQNLQSAKAGDPLGLASTIEQIAMANQILSLKLARQVAEIRAARG